MHINSGPLSIDYIAEKDAGNSRGLRSRVGKPESASLTFTSLAISIRQVKLTVTSFRAQLGNCPLGHNRKPTGSTRLPFHQQGALCFRLDTAPATRLLDSFRERDSEPALEISRGSNQGLSEARYRQQHLQSKRAPEMRLCKLSHSRSGELRNTTGNGTERFQADLALAPGESENRERRSSLFLPLTNFRFLISVPGNRG